MLTPERIINPNNFTPKKSVIITDVVDYVMLSVKEDALIDEALQEKIRKYLLIVNNASFILGSKTGAITRRRPVRAISPRGNEIGRWPTMDEAALANGCQRGAIFRCIKRGTPMRWRKLNGISWEYVDEI